MIEEIKKRFKVSDVVEKKSDLTFFTVSKDDLEFVLISLRDHHNYAHLSFFTTVDYIEQNIFKLAYMLYNYETNHNVCVHVDLDRENPVMHSIHTLWEQAATYQREMYEMFGIDFPGSPRKDENFLLEGWDNIPPMRKDFDTKKYSEETYFPREGRVTHDPREYMREKLYPNFPVGKKGDK